MKVPVIVLNDGSSSGTTSVGRALQALLPEPHLLLGVDDLIDAMPPVTRGRHDAAITVDAAGTVRPGRAFRALEDAWYSGLAAVARSGAGLVVDEVFLDGARSQDRLRRHLAGLSVLWVAVHCNAAVAAAREAGRPDRDPGMAAAQAQSFHVGIAYDVEVDTTDRSAAECAGTVAAALAGAGRAPAPARRRHRPGTAEASGDPAGRP